MLRKIIAGSLAVALGLAFAGCAGTKDASPTDTKLYYNCFKCIEAPIGHK